MSAKLNSINLNLIDNKLINPIYGYILDRICTRTVLIVSHGHIEEAKSALRILIGKQWSRCYPHFGKRLVYGKTSGLRNLLLMRVPNIFVPARYPCEDKNTSENIKKQKRLL